MMNKIAILLVSCLTVPAFAGTVGADQQQQQTTVSGSESVSSAGASNAGNNQTIIFTSPGEQTSTVRYEGGTTSEVTGTTKVKNTPSVTGSPLVSSNDTCMGSVSGAVNVPGFGIGGGKTYIDANCVMLKNSRELWNMGMRGAALARMCMDADNREALELTGFTCPQTEREKKAAVVQATE